MRVLFGLLVVALAAVAALAPVDARFVERWYSTGIYPFIQQVVTPVSNLVPFALLDVLAVTAFGAVVVMLVRAFLRARRKRSLKPVFITGVRLVVAGAFVYLLFLAV